MGTPQRSQNGQEEWFLFNNMKFLSFLKELSRTGKTSSIPVYQYEFLSGAIGIGKQ